MSRFACIAIALFALVGCSSSSAAPPVAESKPVGEARVVDQLCATRGAVTAASIREPVVRAVAPSAHGDAGELRFVYDGPTDEVVPLASGQVRRQLGLKLRAADGCNLVYVMWRLGRTPTIDVSIKSNPGDRTHADCGAGGYRKVTPDRAVPPPDLTPGTAHRLSAAIRGDVLTAEVDGELVWRGRLGPAARRLRGPVGLRTDNVALSSVELRAAPASAPVAAAIPSRCR